MTLYQQTDSEIDDPKKSRQKHPLIGSVLHGPARGAARSGGGSGSVSHPLVMEKKAQVTDAVVNVNQPNVTKQTVLRWLERPAQRSLRESQNGVRFPWKLRRIPIAWPRDRHVEEH